MNEADPDELARAASPQQADKVLKQANSRVKVEIGPEADKAWAERVSN